MYEIRVTHSVSPVLVDITIIDSEFIHLSSNLLRQSFREVSEVIQVGLLSHIQRLLHDDHFTTIQSPRLLVLAVKMIRVADAVCTFLADACQLYLSPNDDYVLSRALPILP